MIVVLGKQPRSGTTLLVRMFDAGGQPAIRDIDGPYAETWQCGRAMYNPVDVLQDQINKPGVIKLFRPQIVTLIANGLRPDAVVVPVRPYQESENSWLALGHKDLDQSAQIERWHEDTMWCLQDVKVPVHISRFHALVDRPYEESKRLAALLSCGLDVDAMAAVPDQTQRHWPISDG